MRIIVSEEIRKLCPSFKGAAIYAQVKNSAYSQPLWDEIQVTSAAFCERFTTESIKTFSPIQATRQAYRNCGKDPSRYRPSGESLIRRILQGKPLYQIDTLVDLINLASIKEGYSIGGFDADKVQGETLTLGIGKAEEPYEGIGRGLLNIEGLPVYRDALGGIGTPTSDHERTKMNIKTTHLLALVNGYDGDDIRIRGTAEHIQRLIRTYAESDGETIWMYE